MEINKLKFLSPNAIAYSDQEITPDWEESRNKIFETI
jgi:hypothetical protein